MNNLREKILACATFKVRYEQAVYGSFPFWDRGYAVLAKSAGCRDNWIDALKLACQRYGEPPENVAEHPGLFALPLQNGTRMIVGAFPNGCDDQGRPGARGFHAVFVSRWMYLKTGCDPFAFAGCLRQDWTAGDVSATLPGGSFAVRVWNRNKDKGRRESVPDGRIAVIADAVREGRRVVVASAEPIDDLARSVWRSLPLRVRDRASLATWAFSNDNQFDLAAVPRTGSLAHDPREWKFDA